MKEITMFWIAITLVVLACKEDYNKQLQSAAFQKSDSIFNTQIEVYKKWSDSICMNQTEHQLQSILDSILMVRREQVKELRKME